jgi:hypothetical protein
MQQPNFFINTKGEISRLFLERGITTFVEAGEFVARLQYGRNSHKEDIKTLFSDNCGTCSTKHALLKRLADEQGRQDIKLIMGIFCMDKENTPKVAEVLKKYKLPYLLEAHNYLKYNDIRLDFTLPKEKALDFENSLLEEIEIEPTQITTFKIEYHQKALAHWLACNDHFPYTLAQLWQIREECIQALST